MLTVAQIETFKRDGVLILNNIFTHEEIQTVRESVLSFLQHPDTSVAWFTSLEKHAVHGFDTSPTLSPLHHPRLAKVYHALHQQADWAGENELIIRPHEVNVPWCGARAPHIDFPINRPLRTLANNVIYLTDVQPQGGAFMYWPGSHQKVWNYFRENPADYLAKGEKSQDQIMSALLACVDNQPVEFTGRAGAVLIWHSLLLHSASVNTRSAARIASFGRWGVLYEEKPYDFCDDIWAYWDFCPDVQPAMTAPQS